MNSLKKYRNIMLCSLFLVSSGYAQAEESQNTVMDCARSAIVSEVNYLGDGEFSFTLQSSDSSNITDSGVFGERDHVVLAFNADLLEGVRIVVYSDNELITREDIKLSGRELINLLLQKMCTHANINLTFAVATSDSIDLNADTSFDIVYFQVNEE